MFRLHSSRVMLVLLLSVMFSCGRGENNNNYPSGASDSLALTIAVASNFHFPLSQLISNSDYWSAQAITLVVGSSGTLYAQLTQGAPFDLFFSADAQRPLRLEQAGLASGRTSYASGKLVLYTGTNNPSALLTNNKLAITGKLAIANPDLAPFGNAAMAYISTLTNAQELQRQLVLGANVTQAFQFVDSGNAQAALLAESVLINAHHTLKKAHYRHYVTISDHLYPPIIQQVVIANSASSAARAQAFIDFVLSDSAQQQLASLGYLPLRKIVQ